MRISENYIGKGTNMGVSSNQASSSTDVTECACKCHTRPTEDGEDYSGVDYFKCSHCSPKQDTWDFEKRYIDFKTIEDRDRCIAWLNEELQNQRQEIIKRIKQQWQDGDPTLSAREAIGELLDELEKE